MTNAIVRKDLLLFRRESLLGVVLVAGIALIAGSLLAGLQRERVFEKERAEAQAADKRVWMDQGERNPHSAAHFSRYAFRPASPLALIDPGTSDYAGLAVWMEAHYQDPAVFRRAEDTGELGRYLQLSPAFLVLAVAPLLVFLMMSASVAGEREDGTLRQLLATGVGVREFFLGKYLAGLRLTLVAFAFVFVPVLIVGLITAPAGTDAALRVAALFAVYSLYLATCVAVALAVSAWFRKRQSAFLALAAVWVTAMILVPRFAADVSTGFYPQPDAREVSSRLSAASAAYYTDTDRQAQIEREVLERYGVESVDELPINYGAYVLQVSEDLSEPEFDRLYADLNKRYAAQEAVKRWLSLLTPAIAAANLSRGLAGTDRAHQNEFTAAAERHRRDMVELLNEDYMLNAGDAGAAYRGDAALWARFEDFDHGPPALGAIGGRYLVDAAVLLLWFLLASVMAHRLVARAVRGEVAAA